MTDPASRPSYQELHIATSASDRKSPLTEHRGPGQTWPPKLRRGEHAALARQLAGQAVAEPADERLISPRIVPTVRGLPG